MLRLTTVQICSLKVWTFDFHLITLQGKRENLSKRAAKIEWSRTKIVSSKFKIYQKYYSLKAISSKVCSIYYKAFLLFQTCLGFFSLFFIVSLLYNIKSSRRNKHNNSAFVLLRPRAKLYLPVGNN
jgi:hypothetical protein